MANAALERNPYFNGTAQQQPAYAPQGGAAPRGAQSQAAPGWQQPGAPGVQQHGAPQYGAPQYGAQPGWQQPGPQQQYAPSADALNHQFGMPAASADQMGRMSVEDTIAKSAVLFGIVLVTAIANWLITMAQPTLGLTLAIVGSFAALITGLVLAFSKKVRVSAVMIFAVSEGFLVGGYSAYLEAYFPGVVVQAVLATFVVVGVTLALFTSGKVRTSPKLTKFFMIAGLSYLVFSLINFGLMVFNVTDNPLGMRGVEIFGIPLGVFLGIFAVVMGAYLLISDFEFIQQGSRNGAPRVYGWLGAYALVSSVVYIYLELLRLIAIMRSND